MIDLEHSTMSLDVAASLCQTAADIGLTAFVRIPEREYGAIGALLDGGAAGIIAPRVESAAEAATVARACRFAPRGQRSQLATVPRFGMRPVPAAELNPALDDATIAAILIETPAGVANADGIAAVDGVDMLAFGANDFTAELGVPGRYDDPRVTAAVAALPALVNETGSSSWSAASATPHGCASLTHSGSPDAADRDRYRHAVRRRGRPRGKVPSMTDILRCTPMRAARATRPRPSSCRRARATAHFHVFEPGYPHVPDPHYTFPDGTIDQYLAMTGALGIERMVLVQPTFYGTDNSLLVHTLRRLGPRCAGVVRIEEDTSDAELDAFHAIGVRAIRLDLFARAPGPRETSATSAGWPRGPPRAAGTCSSTRRARSCATCCRSSPSLRTPSSSTTWAT